MLGIVLAHRKFLNIASSHEVEQVLSPRTIIGIGEPTLWLSDEKNKPESTVESVVEGFAKSCGLRSFTPGK